MQVWRHFLKHLPESGREQQANEHSTASQSSSSLSARLHLSGFLKQQTSASVFYTPVDNDSDAVVNCSENKLNGHSYTMDQHSPQDRGQTSTNSPASGVNNDGSPASADVVKPTLQPKPNKTRKLSPPHLPPPPPPAAQQQPQHIADSAVNDSQKRTGALVVCRHGTLYPSGCTSLSTRETSSSTTKPLPPVCITPTFSSAACAFHTSWSHAVCACMCLNVNQAGTNRNCCTQRLVMLYAQIYY